MKSQKQIIKEQMKPTCYKCGKLADYCYHGTWVCIKCKSFESGEADGK